MEILDDNMPAYSLSDGDHIMFADEVLENISVSDDGDTVTVVGLSHVTGDMETYPLDPDFIVSTWEA